MISHLKSFALMIFSAVLILEHIENHRLKSDLAQTQTLLQTSIQNFNNMCDMFDKENLAHDYDRARWKTNAPGREEIKEAIAIAASVAKGICEAEIKNKDFRPDPDDILSQILRAYYAYQAAKKSTNDAPIIFQIDLTPRPTL
jgi:hypothetical protein